MTQPIPEGFHAVTPHLILDNTTEAIEFYKKAFGAEEMCRMPFPNDPQKTMHAQIRIGNSVLMLGDACPEYGKKSPKALGGTGVTLHIYVEDVDTLFKQAVDAGMKVTMPLEDTFWGDRYGTVEDPYGHSWSLATHTKDMTPEEMMAGAEEMMAQKV